MVLSKRSSFHLLPFLIILQVTAKTILKSKAGCTFDLSANSPQWPSHFFDETSQIVLPVLEGSTRIINLDVGQQVTVACVGPDNYLLNTAIQFNPAICSSTGSTLLLRSTGEELSYDQLGCLVQNKDILVEEGTCANGPGTNIKVGWNFDGTFVPLFDMCHDEKLELNYYSTNTVFGKSAAADDKDNDRPYPFLQEEYYPGLDVNTLYTQVEQTKTVAMIVGSDELAAIYINVTKDHYFSRGHMAPDGDFIDAASQDATYYFMNVAPQFQSFNNGNWKWLEIGVRKVAIARDVILTIYTGTHEVLTLADINGVQQPIYLAFDENGNGLIPAPKYFWKLIHDPVTNTATGVVGINNPHLKTVEPEDIFCPDVCDQVPWIGQNIFYPHDINTGYTFCCTAADLHKIVSFAPDLDVPLFV